MLLGGFFYKQKEIRISLRKLEEQVNNIFKTTHITQLIKLLFLMLFISHLFACSWIIITIIAPKDLQNWISLRKNIDPSSWSQIYLNSYYFASVTMITVGYGDITPQNDYEIVLCLFTIFIACCVFAYTVNSIGQIFNEL